MSPTREIIWSSYQQAILNNLASGKGHTVILARAGASKTTVLIESLKYIPTDKKTLLVAFNKAIADELRSRAPARIECSTLHSLGLRAIKSSFDSNIKLNKNKAFGIVQSLIPPQYKGVKSIIPFILETCRAISLSKSYLLSSSGEVDELMDKFNINSFFFPREEYIKFILDCLAECKNQRHHIDYDDMIYFIYAYNIPLDKFDRVLVDEGQDLNSSQIYMVLSSIAADGRLALFGDNFQSLYSWRGAETDALGKLSTQLNATVLSLPISYRCPKKVVSLAQEIVADIQHAPSAEPGWIIPLKEDKLLSVVKGNDFVLSRTNAPLIKYCLDCIKNKTPAIMQGKDIASSLTATIAASKYKKIADYIKWLDNWFESEKTRLSSRNRDISQLKDKYDCLLNLSEGCASTDEMRDKINALFDNSGFIKPIIFSTVHQAKGMEKDRVFLLNWTFKRGLSQEEDNIYYVALTRARKELYFVDK